jgi:hypothetical protein
MADEIRLVTFEGENVAPVNDALMWDAAIGDSGVIYGCETTLKNASTLHIAAGYGVICGRHFQVFESDIPVTLSSTGDLLGRLYVHMDLSDATEPIQILIETAASLTPEEQDANINIINGIWDMNMATFAVNALTISNLQNVFSTVAGGGSNLIAGTETGATASQAYVKGQYIIWGGRLWEVTAAIAQGDQFVIGSNLSATSTTVGNELTELNSRLTASDGLNFRFSTDGEGNYGYLDGDDTFVPFSSGLNGAEYYNIPCNSQQGFAVNEDFGIKQNATFSDVNNCDASIEYVYTGYFSLVVRRAGYYTTNGGGSYGNYTNQYFNVGDYIVRGINPGASNGWYYQGVVYYTPESQQ